MTFLIPLAITAVAFAIAYHRVNPPGPRPFNFGAVDIFAFFEAVFYYGAAIIVSAVSWIVWLSWLAFS